MACYEELSESVVSGMRKKVIELVNELIAAGHEPMKIVNEGLLAGMGIVAEEFKNGEMFVPDVLMSAKCMNSGLEILKPLLSESDMKSQGKVIIATVQGDLHDIGKNLVGMLMESGGLEVIDLGVDVSPEKFVEAVKLHQPNILGMAALLTTTMICMKDTIDLLAKEGLRDKVKVMVGGAPLSQNYSDSIGADAFAPDAATAVTLCKSLIAQA